MMRLTKNLMLVLSTGAILAFFSEHLFWAHVREGDSLLNWVSTWLAYSFVSFLFTSIIVWFRVRSVWAVFLAGAVFGWLTEGVVVQTAYDMLPFSLSFTGLSWHAMISVWVGWYALQKSLRSNNFWRAAILASLVGIVYGLWAVSWWQEPDGRVTSLASFAAFTLITTALACLAYWLAGWSSSAPFAPGRAVIIAAVLLVFAYFGLVTVPARPVSAILLPLLLGISFWGLWKNRRVELPESILDSFAAPGLIRNLPGLFCLPLFGIAIYTLAYTFNLKIHINMPFYLVTMPMGFIFFIISVYKAVQRAHTGSNHPVYNNESIQR